MFVVSAEQQEILNDVEQKIALIPKKSGVVLRKKYNYIFTTNVGLQ